MGKRSSRDEYRGRKRQKHLIMFSAACFSILLLKLFSLQVIQHEDYVGEAENNRVQRERIVAPRGLIKDARGNVLVDNVPRFEIIIKWKNEKQVLNDIRDVVGYFHLDSTSVLARFDLWKKRNSGLAFSVIPGASKKAISAVRENNDYFPNLRVEVRACRRYKFASMAAHVLGYVGEVDAADTSGVNLRGYVPGDMIGKMGLESACENYLRGKDGEKAVVVNAKGIPIAEIDKYSFNPDPGKTVRLTIDAKYQAVLEKIMSKWDAGAAVVMDIHNGGIIAAVSLPGFDPNGFISGISRADWEKLFKGANKPLFNRVLQAAYPPGSTLKVVTAFAALENGVVASNEVITYCTGSHKFGNRVYRCWKAGGHGYMNLYNALVQSCDSYFFQLGEELDVDELARASRKFGFGAPTGIDLPGEARGLVPDRNYYNRRFGKGKWTQGYILNNVIGQGEYLVSVLQMCRAAAAIANEGYLVTPHFIKSIEDEPRRVSLKRKIPGLSSNIIRILKNSMTAAVQTREGTAYWTRSQKVDYAGKTGTAQNPHGEDHAWFMSYAPVTNPRIAMAVVIENAGHGGSIAAPVARDFFEEYFLPDSSAVSSNNAKYPAPFAGGPAR